MAVKQFISAVSIGALLTACAAGPHGYDHRGLKKEGVGALAGSIGGAIAGAHIGKGNGRVAAIAAGTLLGAMIGGEVGRSLDRADMAYYNQVSQHSFERNKTGHTSKWVNPDSGNSGTITPTRTYQSNGQYCREYTQTITVGGKTQDGFGTACRQDDGSWKLS